MSDPAPTSLPAETIAYAAQFFDAARRGDVELLAPALEAGLPSNLCNDKGDTLLMLACYHGRLPLVQLLLAPASSDSVTRRPQVPSNPNVLNDRLQSCLAGAIFKNEVEIVSLLLKHGADPDIGTPSATDTAKLFGKGQTWEVEFEQARKLVRAKREGGEGLIGR